MWRRRTMVRKNPQPSLVYNSRICNDLRETAIYIIMLQNSSDVKLIRITGHLQVTSDNHHKRVVPLASHTQKHEAKQLKEMTRKQYPRAWANLITETTLGCNGIPFKHSAISSTDFPRLLSSSNSLSYRNSGLITTRYWNHSNQQLSYTFRDKNSELGFRQSQARIIHSKLEKWTYKCISSKLKHEIVQQRDRRKYKTELRINELKN